MVRSLLFSLISKPVLWHLNALFTYLDPVMFHHGLRSKSGRVVAEMLSTDLANQPASSSSAATGRSSSSSSQQAHSTSSRSHWDFKFLFPASAIIFATLYGNLYLQYEATGSVCLTSLQHSPYIFYHQIFPRAMWPQSDVSIAIGTVAALAICATFLHNPFNIDRYQVKDRARSGRCVLKIGSQGLYWVLSHIGPSILSYSH